MMSDRARKHSLDYVKNFYNKKHIVYLDDYYRSSHEHHNLKCEICGHIW